MTRPNTAAESDRTAENDQARTEAAPARPAPRVAKYVPRPPVPLARVVLTVNSPSDPGTLVDVEVIICDDDADDMAPWCETRERRQAGWHTAFIAPFNVAFRTLGD